MLKLALAVLAATISLAAHAEMIATVAMPAGWDPLQHEEIRECLADLLSNSRFGAGDEQAAFIVMRDGGGFDCVRWRSNHARRHGIRYTGRIPQGTVAVAHTHPYGSRDPSHQDQKEAARLDVPFLVVSLGSVTMARPGQGTIVNLGQGYVITAGTVSTASSELSRAVPSDPGQR